MVVRFYNMSNGDSSTTSTHTNCNCNTCNHLPHSPTTSTTNTNSTQTTNNLNNGNRAHFQKSGILREIVGNCKEVKIEENFHNLRIVGNNNRIRLTLNVGDITIIGNKTRLKIKTNHGLIKYTGNDGRIILGKESSEQLVDYIGCNGVLKVQNSKKSNQLNVNDEMNNSSKMGSTSLNEKFCNNRKEKYASFSGSPSVSEVLKCHNNFDRKISMPNITTKSFHSENTSSNRTRPSPKSIKHNFGNIVIANSSNICISPYAFTY